MEVFRYETKEKTKKAASEMLHKLFRETRLPILFLSSGGSSLELLDKIQEEVLGNQVTISVLDERYSTDPTVNNFAQLFGRIHPRTFIDTRVQRDETLQELAQRFERELRAWKQQNPHGNIVITQGMGSDGHTAGIMPRYVFDNPNQWVAGYDARVTTTPAFLREMVDYSIAYITGAKKREALERLLAREGTLSQTPARIMREMKNVKLFTDIVY